MDEVYHPGQKTAYQMPLFPFKICPKCNEEKSLEEFETRADTGKHRSDCKGCRKQYLQGYQTAHREQIQQRRKAYGVTHREERRQYHQRYYATHRDQYRQYHQRRQILQREYIRQYLQEYYVAHRDQHRQRTRIYHITHRAQIQRQRRMDYILHKNKYTERARRREANMRGVTIGEVSYHRILRRDGMHCYICSQPILAHHILHFDHVIPLSRGGAHSEENIKPTHQQCNSRKFTKLLSEMDAFDRRGVTE